VFRLLLLIIGMDAVDLRPYGLNLTLKPTTDIFTLGLNVLSSAHRYKPKGSNAYRGFVVGGVPYIARKKLMGGEYGDIYKVEHNGKPYACKINKSMKTPNDVRAFFAEVLIHILLLQSSVGEENGPYVPYLYKVGYDKSTQKTYLITEWLTHTLDYEIVRGTKAENDERLPVILAQVAHALTHWGRELKFNHRDLHTNNVMLLRSPSSSGTLKRVALIDFGLSCLTWKGLVLKGPTLYNDASHPCYKEDRDMPFLLMRLYKYYDDFLSKPLLQQIHRMLGGTVRGAPCDLGALCPEHGLVDVMDQYEFLNRPNVQTPGGATERVEQAFRTMRRGTLTRARVKAKAKSSGMLSGLLPTFFARQAGQQTRKRKRPQTLSEDHAIRTFAPGL
jgi:serine/threonine protein kinase